MVKFIQICYPAVCKGLLVTAMIGGGLMIGNPAGAAGSSKECHQQFEAAKKAGNVKGQTFKEYKAAFCKEETAQKKPEKVENRKGDTQKNPDSGKVTNKKAADKDAVAPVTGNAVFPNSVDKKYASEKDGAARMHTCLDQYKANKANNKNDGLKWIQKGGGYYSECIKHLKSVAAQ